MFLTDRKKMTHELKPIMTLGLSKRTDEGRRFRDPRFLRRKLLLTSKIALIDNSNAKDLDRLSADDETVSKAGF